MRAFLHIVATLTCLTFAKAEGLIEKTYRCPKEAVGLESVQNSNKPYDVRAYLESKGMPFPEGATALYRADYKILTVRNTDTNQKVICKEIFNTTFRLNNETIRAEHKNNVELEVSISNSTQNGKAVVMLNAKLTNGNPYTISWLKENDAAELHIQIVNAKGISPSLTKEGEIQCAPFPGLFVRAHELEAGKTAEWSINVTDLFNLVPDKYLSNVMMWISSPACILSVSGLKFEVGKSVPTVPN
jgi:hypothetical protein